MILALMAAVVAMVISLLVNYILAKFQADVRMVLVLAVGAMLYILIISKGSAGFDSLFIVLSALVYLAGRQRWSYERLFASIFLLTLVLLTFSFASYHFQYGLSLEMVLRNIDAALQNKTLDLSWLGIKDEAGFKEFRRNLEIIFSSAKLLYPALFAIFSAVLALWTTPVFLWFWKRHQGAVPQKGDFHLFYLPDKVIILFLAALAMVLLDIEYDLFWARFIGWNLLLVSLVVYAIQGIALAYYFLIQWKFTKYLALILLAAIFILGFFSLMLLMSVWGVVDFWADFRKIQKNGSSALKAPSNE